MSQAGERFAQFKIVLLGESAVGKLSIVHRFVKNTFDGMRELTIGAAFLTQLVVLPELETTVKFEIWDTAGQERYKLLAPMYYRNANAALCVYDVTSRASFTKAQEWIKELKKQAPEGIVILLVGNKVDLEDERQVTEDEVAQYLESLNQAENRLVLSECSAKSGDGVVDVFIQIARALPVEEALNKARDKRKRVSGVDLNRKQQQQQQAGGCC